MSHTLLFWQPLGPGKIAFSFVCACACVHTHALFFTAVLLIGSVILKPGLCLSFLEMKHKEPEASLQDKSRVTLCGLLNSSEPQSAPPLQAYGRTRCDGTWSFPSLGRVVVPEESTLSCKFT